MNISNELQDRVLGAIENKSPLRIQGSNSKFFYGYETDGEELNISGHVGVTSYEPSELVISARAGTPLKEIEAVLAEQNQMLAFEPPYFGDEATLGGTIACNFSGPRRASRGAARDYVLGAKVLNGKGEILSFGGEVMKNVAGYDVSRLMAGAMGTLGVILDVSLKIMPKPEAELTLVLSVDSKDALKKIRQWSRLPLPISASCIYNQQLFVRLSGTDSGIQAAKKQIGGDELEQADRFWYAIKEQQHDFFQIGDNESLWRLSVASNAPVLPLKGNTLYEWDGALRWLKSNDSADIIRDAVSSYQGHGILFRNDFVQNRDEEIFQPLFPGVLKLHQNLKLAFDPNGIFNPGRMYKTF